MKRAAKRFRKGVKLGGVAVVSLVLVAACGHMGMHLLMGDHADKPAASEFGFAPRTSAHGLYNATLDPIQEIRVRRMQTMRVLITDQMGQAIDGARIAVDGGMPEHGHGLPTQPRVTRYLGNGAYEVEGMKFNMGGWWEVRFAIATDAGVDTVTFNLDL